VPHKTAYSRILRCFDTSAGNPESDLDFTDTHAYAEGFSEVLHGSGRTGLHDPIKSFMVTLPHIFVVGNIVVIQALSRKKKFETIPMISINSLRIFSIVNH